MVGMDDNNKGYNPYNNVGRHLKPAFQEAMPYQTINRALRSEAVANRHLQQTAKDFRKN